MKQIVSLTDNRHLLHLLPQRERPTPWICQQHLEQRKSNKSGSEVWLCNPIHRHYRARWRFPYFSASLLLLRGRSEISRGIAVRIETLKCSQDRFIVLERSSAIWHCYVMITKLENCTRTFGALLVSIFFVCNLCTIDYSAI